MVEWIKLLKILCFVKPLWNISENPLINGTKRKTSGKLFTICLQTIQINYLTRYVLCDTMVLKIRQGQHTSNTNKWKKERKMLSPILSIIIIAEVLFTLFIVWGFLHEKRFVAFEDKIIFAVLKKIRSRRRGIRKWKNTELLFIT